MMEIMIEPLDGIYWDGKSILLGEERKNIEKTFENISIKDKHSSKRGLSVTILNTYLKIEFDKNECVEFIEDVCEFNPKVEVMIYGVDACKTNAVEIFELLKKHNNGEIGDNENGYCYDFKNISVGIWRESIPESLDEFIAEIHNDKSIDETTAQENIEIETLKANYWATIGIGTADYYL